MSCDDKKQTTKSETTQVIAIFATKQNKVPGDSFRFENNLSLDRSVNLDRWYASRTVKLRRTVLGMQVKVSRRFVLAIILSRYGILQDNNVSFQIQLEMYAYALN